MKKNKVNLNITFEYIQKALVFIRQNIDIFLLYLLLNIISYGANIPYSLKILPHFFAIIQSVFLFSSSVYLYLLPFLIWKRLHNEKIGYTWFIKNFIRLALKLFFPLVCTFILLLLPLSIIDRIFHLYILTHTSNNAVDFYPSRGIFWAIVDIITSFFMFSPVIYFLQKKGYIKSLVQSFFITIKHIKFILPLMLACVLYTFITKLFIPFDNSIFGVFNIWIATFLNSIFSVIIYFYYREHYPLELNEDTIQKEKIGSHTNVIYRRIIAIWIDIFLWSIIFIISCLLFGQDFLAKTREVIQGNVFLSNVPLLLFLVAEFFYFLLFEWIFQGTIGKKIMRIKILSENGTKASFKQIFIRNFLRIIDCFPFFIPYLLGLIIIAASDKKQRMGDRLGHTIVSR